MYQINDLVLYSTHGICKINNITEKTFTDEPMQYYELVPLKDLKLQIHIPVGSKKLQMIDLMNEDQALELIANFREAQIVELDRNYFTSQQYSTIISNSQREQMVGLIYTIKSKKQLLAAENKKLPIIEIKALTHLEGVLYNELTYALKTSYDKVEQMVEEAMNH